LAADRNKDGNLSQIEIIQALHKHPELRIALDSRKEQMNLLLEEFGEEISRMSEQTPLNDEKTVGSNSDWDFDERERKASEGDDFQKVVKETLAKTEATLRDLFTTLDKNKDGRITRIELKKKMASKVEEGEKIRSLLKAMLGIEKHEGTRSHAIFEEVFDCVDVDGTGDITFSELANLVLDTEYLVMEMNADDNKPAELAAALATVDADHSGTLTKIELIRAIKKNPEIRKFLSGRPGHVKQALSKAKTGVEASAWITQEGDSPYF